MSHREREHFATQGIRLIEKVNILHVKNKMSEQQRKLFAKRLSNEQSVGSFSEFIDIKTRV